MSQDISALDIKEAFMMLAEYKQDIDEGKYTDLQEIYNKARYGISIQFDIYDYIYDLISFNKIKGGRVTYRGKTIKLSDFWTEIEERNNIIKKWLKDNTEEDAIASSYEIQN